MYPSVRLLFPDSPLKPTTTPYLANVPIRILFLSRIPFAEYKNSM